MVAEAVEKTGYEVRLLDLMFEKNPLKAVRRELETHQPDVIGLSVRNIDNNDMHSPVFYLSELLPLIDTIREVTLAAVVLGGAAISVMPKNILRYTGAAWALTGDGETLFPMLLDKISLGRSPVDVPGCVWIEDGLLNINPPPSSGNTCSSRSPFFPRWINMNAYQARLSSVPLQTKIGCRFNCVYCTYRKIEGGTYRLSDPGEAVDNIKMLSSYGMRQMEFVDNVFNSPYDHALSICEKLAKIKCEASLISLELNPLFIDNELITAMEKAGFSGIGITVESASDQVLEGLRKGFSARHVYRAAEIIRRRDLPCVWIFMMGGPGETKATVKETLRFAEDMVRPEDTAFFGSGIRIYPGTELESIARMQGLLSQPPDEMLEPVFYVSPSVEYGWMIKQVRDAMGRHMNFINSESLSFPALPVIHRLGYRLGLRPPLWKHTRRIRSVLRTVGLDA